MHTRTLFLTLALSGMLTAISAQAQSGRVKVNVPFPFTAADQTLPAGEYVFSNSDHKVMIADPHKSIAMLLANYVSGRKAPETGQVVFLCYGRKCFVSEIWAPGQDVGGQVVRSHTQMGVARHQAPAYFALLGNGR